MRQLHRGERGKHAFGDMGDVVEADHGDVFRHSQTERGQRALAVHRDFVVAAEERGWRSPQCHQLARMSVILLRRLDGVANQGLIISDVVVVQGLAISPQATVNGGEGRDLRIVLPEVNESDALVAGGNGGGGGLVTAIEFIGHDRRRGSVFEETVCQHSRQALDACWQVHRAMIHRGVDDALDRAREIH